MKTFHIDGDAVRLYFTNFNNGTEDEEFKEILSVLQSNNCVIGETLMGPDCDLIPCKAASVEFDVIRTIDGGGSFIYCGNPDGMRVIKNMFESEAK